MTIANPGWSQVNGSEVEASPWIRNPLTIFIVFVNSGSILTP